MLLFCSALNGERFSGERGSFGAEKVEDKGIERKRFLAKKYSVLFFLEMPLKPMNVLDLPKI